MAAVGDRFGDWTLVAPAAPDAWGKRRWQARCACERVLVVSETHLIRGLSLRCRSCSISRRCTTHGASRSPLYAVWSMMNARCHCETNKSFARYGGRGIAVCDRWRASFEAFAADLADVGPRPSPRHSIDRIDNSRGYEPGNVRWATPREQRLNSRNVRLITVAGRTQCIADWAREKGFV